MEKTKGMNIRTIIDKYHVETSALANRIVEEIINELKKDALTYKQVEEDVLFIKRQFNYMNGNNNEHLFDEIKRVLEKEKNDLPITNRSMV